MAVVTLPPWVSYGNPWDLIEEKGGREVPKERVDNERVRWGNSFEPHAKKIFYTKIAPEWKFADCGFVEHRRISFLGCSPDGILAKDDGSLSMVEIKCPRWKSKGGEVSARKFVDGIPIHHWIQMQVQMEVCDIDTCHYFVCNFQFYQDYESYLADEGAIKGKLEGSGYLFEYWFLESYELQVVSRDSSWFSSIERTLYDFWALVEEASSPLRKRKMMESMELPLQFQNWKEKVSVMDTYNWAHKDPFMDWLRIWGEEFGWVPDTEMDDYMESYDFDLFIRRRSGLFRDSLFLDIMSRMKVDREEIDEPNPLMGVRDLLDRTQRLVTQGKTMIRNALLYNPGEKIWGIADLLVRNTHPLIANLDPYRNAFRNAYSIILVRSNALHFNSDGKTLRNTPVQRAFKHQGYLLSKIMQVQFGLAVPPHVYIIGKRWFYEKGASKYSGNSPKAALLNFKGRDEDVMDEVSDAVDWIRKVRRDGKGMKIGSCPEMMPNMANRNSYPWASAKMSIAFKYGEPSLLYNVGDEIRTRLFDKKIMDVRKAKFEDLEIPDHYKGKKVMETFFRMNFGDGGEVVSRGSLDSLPGLPEREALEFFIDFETIGEDFDRFDPIIFEIGLGICIPGEDEMKFETFFSEQPTEEAEENAIYAWLMRMKYLSGKYRCPNPRIYHWTKAEMAFKKVMDRERFAGFKKWVEGARWTDLHEIFRESPIVIKGAYDFSLKSTLRAMRTNGLVNFDYSECTIKNGKQAMMAYYRGHETPATDPSLPHEHIAEYNKIDVMALHAILELVSGKR